MLTRFIVFLVIVALGLTALAVSNRSVAETNNGLPIVSTQAVTNPNGEAVINYRVAPCVRQEPIITPPIEET